VKTNARISETAYLLHAIAYRETSLIVDLFTREHGRIAAVAKGAKRRSSALRGVLLQFQPLLVTWVGRNELRNLSSAEWAGGQIAPTGDALICAFYMNELIVRLLPREDPHPTLYDGYGATLAALGEGRPIDETLRRFEWLMLRETGYAPDLEHDAEQRPIRTDARYSWFPSHGFVVAQAGAEPAYSGATLRDLSVGRFDTQESRAQAKYLTRSILAHHLEGAPLNTRQILIDLHRI
jgi:DNA repair protein RecO (recombination protein O)